MNEMFPGFEKMKMITIKEGADYLGLKPQALYLAIKKNLLKATKIKRKFYISLRMLDEYKENRYSRKHSIFNGEPLFSEDEVSVKELSKILNLNITQVYYLVRSKMINNYRKGTAYIIKKKDIEKYLNSIR